MEMVAEPFTGGRSQAVRIPEADRFEGADEVIPRKEGDVLIVTPARKNWASFADEAARADGDFMVERPDSMDGSRIVF